MNDCPSRPSGREDKTRLIRQVTRAIIQYGAVNVELVRKKYLVWYLTGGIILACLIQIPIPARAEDNANTTNQTSKTRQIAAQAHFRGGLQEVQNERYAAAVKSFRSAIQLDPSLSEAYLNLGACYERMGDFERGKPFYEKALELEPDNPTLHYLYGTALVRNGQAGAGITRMERAVYLNPKNTDYLFNLGLGYCLVTQYHYAVSCFESVATVISNNSLVWFQLGLTRLNLSQTNEALRAWDRIELDATVAADACYARAGIELRQGDVSNALGHVKLALLLRPGLKEAEHLLARLYQRQGTYRKAADILEKMNNRQQSADIEAELALLYYEWAANSYTQQNYAAALDQYRQAGRFRPTRSDIHLGIARSALALGNIAEASVALERARRYARTTKEEERIQNLEKEIQVSRKGPDEAEKTP